MNSHLIYEKFHTNIEQEKVLAFFEIPYYSIYHKPHVDTHLAEDHAIKEFPALRKHLSEEYINRKWPNYIKIYTDGSKSNENTGCAFYIPSIKKCGIYKMCSQASILSTEAKAIYKATKYSEELNGSKFLVLSDSLSSLKNIQAITRERKANIWIWKTIEQFNKLRTQNKIVHLVWIPAHSKIQGNEMVDALAKLSAKLDNNNVEKTDPNDLKVIAKNKMIERWQCYWEETKEYKGEHLFKIQSQINIKPWFYKKD